jgi:plasmid stabilization system protein ParE
MKLRLADRAKADLQDIALYTIENFGQRQADIYRGQLQNGLKTLRQFPMIGMASRDLPSGFLAFRVAQHWICYEVNGDVIEVAALIQRLSDFEEK